MSKPKRGGNSSKMSFLSGLKWRMSKDKRPLVRKIAMASNLASDQNDSGQDNKALVEDFNKVQFVLGCDGEQEPSGGNKVNYGGCHESTIGPEAVECRTPTKPLLIKIPNPTVRFEEPVSKIQSSESSDSGYESISVSSASSVSGGSSGSPRLGRLIMRGSYLSLTSGDIDIGPEFLSCAGLGDGDNVSISSRRSSLSQLCLDDDDDTVPWKAALYNKFGRKGRDLGELRDATSIAHIYNGSVLVTDMVNHRVQLYSRSGRHRRTYATEDHSEPWAATVTPSGQVAVTLKRNKCLSLWSGDGQVVRTIGSNIFQCPSGLAVDKKGRFVVTDTQLKKVFILSPAGELIRTLGGRKQSTETEKDSNPNLQPEKCVTFEHPRYVAISKAGRIIVSDSGSHTIKVFDNHGNFEFEFGSYGKEDGQFRIPYGVCTDREDNIIVADHYNNRISMFSSYGEFVQHIVTPDRGLSRPQGVAVRAGHEMRLYITHGDLKAHEVLVYKLYRRFSNVSVHMTYDL